jgi:hypothetical protein
VLLLVPIRKNASKEHVIARPILAIVPEAASKAEAISSEADERPIEELRPRLLRRQPAAHPAGIASAAVTPANSESGSGLAMTVLLWQEVPEANPEPGLLTVDGREDVP